jgi:hypothetical protein
MNRATWLTLAAFAALAGCEDKPDVPLAPEASTLKPTEPPKARSGVQKLAVQTAGSKVDFMMDAPQEKIRGRVKEATKGDVHVDPMDLTKTTGHIQVDIGGIELYQSLAGDDGKFGEEKKNDTQNKHARAWLEIDETTPEDVRAKHSRVEFLLKSVKTDTPDATKLTGETRKVKLTVTGDFLLHQRKTEKTAEIEATLQFKGDKLASVTIKTLKPFGIGLAEHDVRPRDSFGKLAAKTLDVLAPKVAKEAMVDIELVATAEGSVVPASASAEASAPASGAPAAASGAPATSAAASAQPAPSGGASRPVP